MVSASSSVEGSSGQPWKCASTRTLPCRSGEVSSRCLSKMTFFSYSCASFGWPVMVPAMSTIFFGWSAAWPGLAAGQNDPKAHSRIRTDRRKASGIVVCHLNPESRRESQAFRSKDTGVMASRLRELRLQFFQFRADDPGAVGGVRMVAEVILVIILGLVECGQGRDFGDDGRREPPLRGLFRFFGRLFLGGIVIKNDGTILRADVRALAVRGRGIMRFPENLQEFFVGDFPGIEFDLDDLGVAGGARADLLVSRILLCAAGITADDGLHAVQSFEDRFHAPEAAAAKGGLFSFVGRVHGLFGGSVCAGRNQARDEQQPDCAFHFRANFIEAVS